jgi:CheY-like chemotaxis protein
MLAAELETTLTEPARRVLVADDNAHMRRALESILEVWRFEVTAVHDGQAAVAAVGTLRPVAALVDIRLPGFDGFEVARRLRADRTTPAGLVLIAMTGSSDPRDRAAALAAGFDHHFVKPMPPDLLRALLDRAAADAAAKLVSC